MALADTILSKASHMRADRVGGDVQAGRWHAVRTDSPVRWRCPRWTVLRRPDCLVLPAPDYLASHRTILRCYAGLSCDATSDCLAMKMDLSYTTRVHTCACYRFWIWVWAWAWLSLKGGGCSEARLSSKQESSIG
jgi:hypothetical protein